MLRRRSIRSVQGEKAFGITKQAVDCWTDVSRLTLARFGLASCPVHNGSITGK